MKIMKWRRFPVLALAAVTAFGAGVLNDTGAAKSYVSMLDGDWTGLSTGQTNWPTHQWTGPFPIPEPNGPYHWPDCPEVTPVVPLDPHGSIRPIWTPHCPTPRPLPTCWRILPCSVTFPALVPLCPTHWHGCPEPTPVEPVCKVPDPVTSPGQPGSIRPVWTPHFPTPWPLPTYRRILPCSVTFPALVPLCPTHWHGCPEPIPVEPVCKVPDPVTPPGQPWPDCPSWMPDCTEPIECASLTYCPEPEPVQTFNKAFHGEIEIEERGTFDHLEIPLHL